MPIADDLQVDLGPGRHSSNLETELVNIGTLAAFILICSSIMVLRKKRPDLDRRFRTPFVPVVPLIGIGFSIYLIISLPEITWIRFIVWMVVGLVIYAFYGRRKSKLAKQ